LSLVFKVSVYPPFIDISMKKEEKSKICLRRKRVDKKKKKKYEQRKAYL